MQFIIRDVRVVKRSRFDPLSVKLLLFRNIALKASRGIEARFLVRFKRPRYNYRAESFQEKVAKQLKSLDSRIDIRLCPEIHQKLLIVDDREAWLGSANLNYRGMGGKRDLILWTNDKEVVGKLTEIFNRRWMQKDDVCKYCPKKCIIVT
jgi:phosphatidylserine/phosphatidylglycerophosphate/cardiolipin synthase-like enzyme